MTMTVLTYSKTKLSRPDQRTNCWRTFVLFCQNQFTTWSCQWILMLEWPSLTQNSRGMLARSIAWGCLTPWTTLCLRLLFSWPFGSQLKSLTKSLTYSTAAPALTRPPLNPALPLQLQTCQGSSPWFFK